MLLYEHPLSSYAQKVKIALREKGLAFSLETPETLGTGIASGPFGEANPRVEVPVLVDGEARIFDSTIILDYLEEKWLTPPLLPRDPAARAAARMVEDVCDTHYEAINWGLGEIRWFGRAEGALADTLRVAAASQTAQLQDWLVKRLGKRDWFTGEGFAWPISPWPPTSIVPSITAWVRHQAHRSTAGSTGCASGPPSRGPSPNSRPRPSGWPVLPSATPPKAGAANTATIGWNG